MKLRINVEGTEYDVLVDVLPESTVLSAETEIEISPLNAPPPPSDTIPDDRICRSPIAGAVVSISVAPGMRVHRDDPVVTIEAMKMQTAIGAPLAGIVDEVCVKPGDAVRPGQMLCKLV